LRHPNIIPLLGINTTLFFSSFSLVFPWMVNGDIIMFLKENSDHDKLQSTCEIMASLEYFHSFSPPIVHGDIKGANILVSKDYHCLLIDFGLAAITAETMSTIHTILGVIKGSTQWMAPELFTITDGGSNCKDTKKDQTPQEIYAFACTVFEVRCNDSNAKYPI
ncbi:kinase-like protein, partial [Marasmius fiardii PR-910]